MLHLLSVVQSLITAHDQFKATLPEADKERMATLGIHNEILKIAQTYGIKLSGINPYTNLSPQDISTKWDTVSERARLNRITVSEKKCVVDLSFNNYSWFV